MKTRNDWQNVMNENENYFRENIDYPDNSYRMTQILKLLDGTELSIQASWGHYCNPKLTVRDYNKYDSFEIGFPSVKFESLMEYAEDPENPTDTVYGYVPKEVIDEIVLNCGGVIVD